MTTALTLALRLFLSALFEVHALPFEHNDAECFIAEAGERGAPGLFVLDGWRLSAHGNAEPEAAFTVELLPGTSAVDIADIDGDGLSEVVGICGERLVSYRLDGEGPAEPKDLFLLATQFAAPAAHPFLHVLVIKRDGEPLLALPCEATLELRRASGELVEQCPIGPDAPQHVTYGRPFAIWEVDPPQVGHAEALEFRVSRILASKPDLPDGLLPVEAVGPVFQRATTRQARDAAELEPDAWPWFPVRLDRRIPLRALYALTGPGHGDTLIRIQQPDPAGSEGRNGPVLTGPKRRYPGALLLIEDMLPDFNADGYTDLLLWKAADPTPTVDGMARAMMGGRWPLRVTMHLFAPDKERFAPRSAGSILLEAPLTWFLTSGSGAPLAHVALCDVDGDGATDFGCSTEDRTYSVWHCSGAGFAVEPDFYQVFDESIQEVVLQVDLDGYGRRSIVLRGEERFFVLKAASPLEFPPAPATRAAGSDVNVAEPVKPATGPE